MLSLSEEHHGPTILVVSSVGLLREQTLLTISKAGLSILSFFIVIIVCLAMSRRKQPSTYVWSTFIHESGWDNAGIAFLTGLVNPNYAFAGLDGPLHLSEDSFNPARTVPQSMISSIIVGFVTAFAFTVAMLYCITDASTLLDSRTG